MSQGRQRPGCTGSSGQACLPSCRYRGAEEQHYKMDERHCEGVGVPGVPSVCLKLIAGCLRQPCRAAHLIGGRLSGDQLPAPLAGTSAPAGCTSCSRPGKGGAGHAVLRCSSKLLCDCQLLTLCRSLGRRLAGASHTAAGGCAQAGGRALWRALRLGVRCRLPLALRASAGLDSRLAGASRPAARRGLADTAFCGAQPGGGGATLLGTTLALGRLQRRLGCLAAGSTGLGWGSRWIGHTRSLAGNSVLLLQGLRRWRRGNRPWHRLLHRDS